MATNASQPGRADPLDGQNIELQPTRMSDYALPDDYANLDEVAATSPVDETGESDRRWQGLEQTRRDEATAAGILAPEPEGESQTKKSRVPKLLVEFYTISYLIFFAILGTLARVGLKALTTYPGAPVTFSVLWANFGGSLIMGFLIEDRKLFSDAMPGSAQSKRSDEEQDVDWEAKLADAKKAAMAAKKTIPLYIGLATGFCGSFTSFSSFISDSFLAMSDSLATPGISSPTGRNGGYSFMALLAVVLVTVCLSLSALFLGAHLAIASERFATSLRYPSTRRILDPLVVVIGWGCWLGAVLLAIFPPHDFWRGRIAFALVFAPLGCLLRFYLSIHLNGKVASFPIGTFAANIFGTAVLGMCYDIAHVPLGGVVGCQVLQGVEDGFCGCLTTISTWVAELSSLRRKHAYAYGTTSVVTALALMIAIMGGLRWTDGFSSLLCSN